MRYEDAAKIGTNVEGYVRCTYARLHDIQNGFLFALQHHDAWKLTDAHLQASDYFDGEHNYGGGAASEQVTQDVIERGANYSEFVEDVPVVKGIRPVTAWGGKKSVEVQLTDYCRDLLWRKANSDYHTKPKWRVERVYILDRRMADGFLLHNKGKREVILETYDESSAFAPQFTNLRCDNPEQVNFEFLKNVSHNDLINRIWKAGYCYAITRIQGEFSAFGKTWKQDMPDPAKFAAMEELMNPDATFLVKEVAIDWFPTNIKGAFIEDPKTGKLVTIEVALDDARKRYERAKAILAATTTFAII